MNNKEHIRLLNDQLRTTGFGGKILITDTVQALKSDDLANLFNLVRTFNEFSADNDPHGEHDFGIVKLEGASYYWKIDYYDRSLRYGSGNLANPSQTTRVMTIMHSCEY